MASDPYYLVREEIQESVRERKGSQRRTVQLADTRAHLLASQVNKLHAGHERWERHPAGSDSRATVAQDLVRVLAGEPDALRAHAPFSARRAGRARSRLAPPTGWRVRQCAVAGACAPSPQRCAAAFVPLSWK
jgi:hypothetical protein